MCGTGLAQLVNVKRKSMVAKIAAVAGIGVVLLIARAQAGQATTAADSSAGATVVAAAMLAVGIASMPARRR